MSVAALLEEAGYRRGGPPLRYGEGAFMKDLTRLYVFRVLRHPRREGGGLDLLFTGEAAAPLSEEERLRRKLRRQKCPEDKIEALVRERLARYAR